MTDREELAVRIEKLTRSLARYMVPSAVDDMKAAAAALRQSPSVEDVARVILDGVFEGFEHGQCEKEWETDYGKEIARVTASIHT